MKPLTLRATNYRCLSDLEWEVTEGATAIVGANGAGKSSRLLAIEHALFGVRSRSFAPLLKRGETELSLELLFTHDSRVLRVRRGYSARGAGKTWLHLDELVDGDFTAPLTKETAAETQVEINRLLGLSRETYRASAYSPQDDGGAWTEADPAARKSVLAEILALSEWDDLQTEAKRRRQLVQAELAPLKVEASLHDDSVSRASEIQMAVGQARAEELLLAGREEGLALRIPDLQRAAREAHTAAAQAESRLEAAKAAKLRRDQAAEQREGLVGRIDDAHDKLRAIETQAALASRLPALERTQREEQAERERILAAANAEMAAYRERRARVETARIAYNIATGRSTDSEAALERARTRYAAASSDDPECPTCHQALAADTHSDTLARLHEELSVAEEEHATLVTAFAVSVADLQAADQALGAEPGSADVYETKNLIEDIAAARTAQQAVAAADGWRDQLAHQEQELKQITETLARLEREYQDAERAAATVPGALGALATAERALKEATTEDADIRRKRVGAASEVARLTAELDQAQERARASKEAGARAVELEQSLTTLLLLEKGYGRDGVPSLIVETVALPAIQTEANRVLDALDSPFRVDLRSQRETKSGETRDALDIVIHTPTGEASYETLSGGEATRVNIALRIGLARLLASRRGAEIGIFAIDEPDGLDQDGSDRLAEILKDLARTTFRSVVLVSHQLGLKDALDQMIVVSSESVHVEEVAA